MGVSDEEANALQSILWLGINGKHIPDSEVLREVPIDESSSFNQLTVELEVLSIALCMSAVHLRVLCIAFPHKVEEAIFVIREQCLL